MMDIGKDLQSAYEEGYKQGRYDEQVEAEKSLPKWIPCSERLPSEGGFYLCTTEDCVTILEFLMGNSHFNESPSFVSDTLGRCNDYVVAWMPLPEPYREDGE